MIFDLAKYLSGVADMVGIVNWSINPRYIPSGSSEETHAFQFEGKGNLPRLLHKANDKLIANIKTDINEEANTVTLY